MEEFKNIKNWVVVIAIAALWFGVPYLWEKTGSTKPGSFQEKSDYKTRIYVHLYPENSRTKNYRLPADIERIDGAYYIHKVYWPNNGYLEFLNECFTPLYEESASCTVVRDNGNELDYEVKLTNIIAK